MLPEDWVVSSAREETLGRISHVVEYAVLTLLVFRGIYNGNRISTKNALFSMGFSMMYALSDEIHQIIVPGRAFQLLDLSLDVVVIILGLGIFLLLKRHKRDHQIDPISKN